MTRQPPASALPEVEEIRGRAVTLWCDPTDRAAFYPGFWNDPAAHGLREYVALLLADFQALLARAEGARREALEEAARVAETHYLQSCPTLCGSSIAQAIRSLKGGA